MRRYKVSHSRNGHAWSTFPVSINLTYLTCETSNNDNDIIIISNYSSKKSKTGTAATEIKFKFDEINTWRREESTINVYNTECYHLVSYMLQHASNILPAVVPLHSLIFHIQILLHLKCCSSVINSYHISSRNRLSENYHWYYKMMIISFIVNYDKHSRI